MSTGSREIEPLEDAILDNIRAKMLNLRNQRLTEDLWSTDDVADLVLEVDRLRGRKVQSVSAGQIAPPIPITCKHCGKRLTYLTSYRHEDDPPFYFIEAPGIGQQPPLTTTVTIAFPTHVPEPGNG